MKCLICHSEDIESKRVQEEIVLEEDIVRIPVDVMTCLNCGERYYDRRTVRYLEDIERKLKSGLIPLRQAGRVLVQEG